MSLTSALRAIDVLLKHFAVNSNQLRDWHSPRRGGRSISLSKWPFLISVKVTLREVSKEYDLGCMVPVKNRWTGFRFLWFWNIETGYAIMKNRLFLADTNAGISAIRLDSRSWTSSQAKALQAESDRCILKYGHRFLTLSLGFTCAFRWVLIGTHAPYSITDINFPRIFAWLCAAKSLIVSGSFACVSRVRPQDAGPPSRQPHGMVLSLHPAKSRHIGSHPPSPPQGYPTIRRRQDLHTSLSFFTIIRLGLLNETRIQP